MKKVGLVILTAIIFVLAITFSSCGEKVILPSSAISLSMITNSDGTITQEIDFSLQTQKLKELNVNERLIKDIKNNFLASVNSLKNEFYISFLLIYSLNPDKDFQIGESAVISQPYVDDEADVVGFNITYKSLAALQYFQTGKRQEDDELLGKTIPIKFYSHAESEGKFPFAGEFTNKMGDKLTVGERYLNIYKACFNRTISNDICTQLDTPSFVYDYATVYTNLRTNADVQLSNGGLNHNIWIKDLTNYKDATIKLSSTVVYSGWWYLSLLMVAILAFGIGLLIIKLKK